MYDGFAQKIKSKPNAVWSIIQLRGYYDEQEFPEFTWLKYTTT